MNVSPGDPSGIPFPVSWKNPRCLSFANTPCLSWDLLPQPSIHDSSVQLNVRIVKHISDTRKTELFSISHFPPSAAGNRTVRLADCWAPWPDYRPIIRSWRNQSCPLCILSCVSVSQSASWIIPFAERGEWRREQTCLVMDLNRDCS